MPPGFRRLVRTLPCLLAAAGALRAQGDEATAARLRDLAVERLTAQWQTERSAALSLAKSKGWPASGLIGDMGRWELMAVPSTGAPLVNATLALNAAKSANVQPVHALVPSIRGAGVTIGVWDEGVINVTHVEFDDAGTPRAAMGDSAPVATGHPTAVAGVAIAAGVDAGVLGSAPKALAKGYDWNSNIAETTAAAPLGPQDTGAVLVSNHSYGFLHGWENTTTSGNAGWHLFGSGFNPAGGGSREDEKFGKYDTYTRQLDQLSADYPWHLVFWAAGNDRDDVLNAGATVFYYYDSTAMAWLSAVPNVATNPYSDGYDGGGFDTTITRATAKNVVAVGSVTDAVTAGARDPSAAAPSAFSGWGPADDGRVKPDLVANGQGVRMPTRTSNTSYASSSGTSFSTPSAAGVGLLIHSAARTHAAAWMPRACMVKALLIHGATDIGEAGPDYKYGWGLVDGLASVQPVVALGAAATASQTPVAEGLLDATTPPGGDAYTVEWDGVAPLKATICWTDPPGTANDTTLDLRTPVLVNDLDLRISGPGGTFEPFVLDVDSPAAPATTGDNVVDPVEQVIVPAGSAAGTYTLAVSHKGTLSGGSQWYALVTTGQTAPAADPLAVTAVEPTAVEVNTATVLALTLVGEAIVPGSVAVLRGTGGNPDIPATGELAAGNRLFCSVDLTGAPAGEYDVVVARPDGSEATLVEGFAITDPHSEIGEWRILDR